MKNRLGLVCAVSEESRGLLDHLGAVRPVALGPGLFYFGVSRTMQLAVVVAGVGKTNAAQAVTLLLERVPVWAVVSFGVGGAYPGTGLCPGDVAVATEEIHGDEGVETGGGFRSVYRLGLPPEGRLRQTYPVDARLASLFRDAARTCSLQPAQGPFVTVSTCSGTDRRAHRLRTRYGAVCENMEGAAVAQVAQAYGVPFCEIRGISNMAGRRDRKAWKLKAACDAVSMVIAEALRRIDDAGQRWKN